MPSPEWNWDTFPTYVLQQDALDQYLRNIFGNYNFYTQVRNSNYTFWIPRKLSESERRALRRIRYTAIRDPSSTTETLPQAITSDAESVYSNFSSDAETAVSELTTDAETLVTESVSGVSSEEKKQIVKQFSSAVAEQFADLPTFSSSNVSQTRARVVFARKLGRYSMIVTQDTLRTVQNTRKRNAVKAVYWHRSDIAEEITKNIFPATGQELKSEKESAFLAKQPNPQSSEDKITSWLDYDGPYTGDPEHGYGSMGDIGLAGFKEDMEPEPLDKEASEITQEDKDIRQYLIAHEEFRKLTFELLDVARHYCIDTMALIQRDISRAVGSSRTSTQTSTVHFRAKWSIRQFLNEYDPDLEDIGQILTITGNSHDAQMTTIECYLKQTWPEQPFTLISELQAAVFGHKTTIRTQDERSLTGVVEVTLEEDIVHVTTNGTAEFLCAIGQQVAWLGSVCRFPETELCYCNTLWSHVEPEGKALDGSYDFYFGIDYMSDPFDKDEIQMCWHSLIAGSTISTGFPIPHRSIEDKGLQVPTEIMAALAGVSTAVDIGTGYFVKGETCALYPVCRNKNQDHVQWHLFDNGEESLDYDDLETRVPGIFKQEKLTLEEISSTTAFVGWIPRVINCAATNDIKFIDYSQIKDSEADVAPETAFNISGGSISVAKIVSAGFNWSMSKRKIRASSRKIESYTDLLHDLSNRSIIFYDTEAKRSWLVDGEQATLQIMLHRSKVRKDYVQSDVRIVAADPEQGVSAHSAMRTDERLKLRKDWEAEKGEEMVIWLSKEIKLVWETLKELTAFARSEYGRSNINIGRQRIIGFEYMALIMSTAEFQQCPKSVPLEIDCGEWPEIAKDPASIVLLAKNFQEVLKPPQQMHVCPNFRALPRGKSYLAAELSTVRKFLSNANLSWNVSEHVFTHCKQQNGESCSCDLVQELAKADRKDDKSLEDLWNEGAAIFGAKVRKLQKERKTGKPIHQGRSVATSLVVSTTKLFIPSGSSQASRKA